MIQYDRHRRRFAVALAALAGCVDAIGFLSADGYFVSFMSGNTTRLGVALGTAPAHALAPAHGLGTHLVQLGAFNSAESAKRAWQHFVSRNPRLAGHPNLITKVNVNGRDFWRVQAAGFAGQASATSLCGSLRAQGGACLVMALNAAGRVNGVATADAHAAHPAVRPAAVPAAPAHPRKTNAAR
jgi:hypothetical protein